VAFLSPSLMCSHICYSVFLLDFVFVCFEMCVYDRCRLHLCGCVMSGLLLEPSHQPHASAFAVCLLRD
jgi:hypothetical protein